MASMQLNSWQLPRLSGRRRSASRRAGAVILAFVSTRMTFALRLSFALAPNHIPLLLSPVLTTLNLIQASSVMSYQPVCSRLKRMPIPIDTSIDWSNH